MKRGKISVTKLVSGTHVSGGSSLVFHNPIRTSPSIRPVCDIFFVTISLRNNGLDYVVINVNTSYQPTFRGSYRKLRTDFFMAQARSAQATNQRGESEDP